MSNSAGPIYWLQVFHFTQRSSVIKAIRPWLIEWRRPSDLQSVEALKMRSYPRAFGIYDRKTRGLRNENREEVEENENRG